MTLCFCCGFAWGPKSRPVKAKLVGKQRHRDARNGWRYRHISRCFRANLPRSSSHRGGALGSRVTNKKRQEQTLLAGLRALLEANATKSTREKKPKQPKRSKSSANKKSEPKGKDTLWNALQKLVQRTEKKPRELLPQLKKLIEVTEQGHLTEQGKQQGPKRRPSSKPDEATNAVQAPVQSPNRQPARRPPGSVRRPWTVKAVDLGYDHVLSNAHDFAAALDEPAKPLLCQANDTATFEEMASLLKGAKSCTATVIYTGQVNAENESIWTNHHCTTQILPGMCNGTLQLRQCQVAVAAPRGPRTSADH